jgi:hypothetical protein
LIVLEKREASAEINDDFTTNSNYPIEPNVDYNSFVKSLPTSPKTMTNSELQLVENDNSTLCSKQDLSSDMDAAYNQNSESEEEEDSEYELFEDQSMPNTTDNIIQYSPYQEKRVSRNRHLWVRFIGSISHAVSIGKGEFQF